VRVAISGRDAMVDATLHGERVDGCSFS